MLGSAVIWLTQRAKSISSGGWACQINIHITHRAQTEKKEIVEEEEVCDRAWGRENDARLTHPGAIAEVRAGKSKGEPSG